MKLGKFIGGMVVGALVASAIPYEIKRDEENGIVSMHSLLWAWKKTPGEDKNHYAFAIPPSGLDCEAEAESDEPADELAEEAAEAAEEAAEKIADAAKEVLEKAADVG